MALGLAGDKVLLLFVLGQKVQLAIVYCTMAASANNLCGFFESHVKIDEC